MGDTLIRNYDINVSVERLRKKLNFLKQFRVSTKRSRDEIGVIEMKDLHTIEEVKQFVNSHELSFIYVLTQS